MGQNPSEKSVPVYQCGNLNKPLKPVPGLMTVYPTPLSRLCLKR